MDHHLTVENTRRVLINTAGTSEEEVVFMYPTAWWVGACKQKGKGKSETKT